MLTIEVGKCDGCGDCLEVCPEKAISLAEGVAQIDSARCTECGDCVEVCPTGAIRVAMPIAESEPVPIRSGQAEVVAREERARKRGALVTLAGATLGFLGRYVLPRAAEALVNALERRPRQGMTSSGQSPSPSRVVGRGVRRRRRRRGGR
ncbi:MAG: 4Fe-4S binding protein [Chloroflexota bacterium]|nr:4Fe-4S binding protein [Chloroflexota bacterium]